MHRDLKPGNVMDRSAPPQRTRPFRPGSDNLRGGSVPYEPPEPDRRMTTAATAARILAIAARVRRTAEHGPKRWTVRNDAGQEASGRTIAAAVRKLLDPGNYAGDQALRCVAGETYTPFVFDSPVAADEVFRFFEPGGLHLVGVSRFDLRRDLAARGDRRARREIRRVGKANPWASLWKAWKNRRR